MNVGGQNDQPSASGLGTGSAMMSAEHDGRGGGHHSEVGPSGQVEPIQFLALDLWYPDVFKKYWFDYILIIGSPFCSRATHLKLNIDLNHLNTVGMCLLRYPILNQIQ